MREFGCYVIFGTHRRTIEGGKEKKCDELRFYHVFHESVFNLPISKRK